MSDHETVAVETDATVFIDAVSADADLSGYIPDGDQALGHIDNFLALTQKREVKSLFSFCIVQVLSAVERTESVRS